MCAGMAFKFLFHKLFVTKLFLHNLEVIKNHFLHHYLHLETGIHFLEKDPNKLNLKEIQT